MKLELFNILLKDLTQEEKIKFEGGTTISLPGFKVSLNDADKKLCEKIEKLFVNNKFSPPSLEETIKAVGGADAKVKELLAFLVNSGTLINVGEGMVFHKEAILEAEKVIRLHFGKNAELRASDFKEGIGSTRKYAIPLLGYFDQKGLTLRRGEVRVLKEKR